MSYPALIEKREIKLKKLNLKQDLFCKIYATDPQCIGNATYAYMKAYGIKNIQSAKPLSSNLLTKPEVTARINEYLSQDGFNDQSVDKKHNFLIQQYKDLNVSLKAIEHYNKLKKRITERLEISVPKPIMALDEDEVITKIDKKNVIEAQQ
jgi:phage terminase small subunit